MDDTEALVSHYSDPNTRGTWWRPTGGATTKMKVPYLLSIPNALVDLLHNQGTQATPVDVWTTIDDEIANSGMTEVQWETIPRWCIVAGQMGGNNKSLLAINVDLVVINDNEFDTWVGHDLDIALGPQQASMTAALVPDLNTLPDYMQMSRLLASAMGQGMMQFTQAVMPQTAVSATLPGQMAPLDTGKGFNHDRIAKLKDACDVSMANKIPNIWYVI
jgi:hypothetical protein